jgi:hypothetical protein
LASAPFIANLGLGTLHRKRDPDLRLARLHRFAVQARGLEAPRLYGVHRSILECARTAGLSDDRLDDPAVVGHDVVEHYPSLLVSA